MIFRGKIEGDYQLSIKGVDFRNLTAELQQSAERQGVHENITKPYWVSGIFYCVTRKILHPNPHLLKRYIMNGL